MSSSSTVRRSLVVAIVCAMAGALLVSVAPTPSSKRASAALATLAPLRSATAKLVPDSGALWGAAANARGSGDRMQAFTKLESQLGVSMDIHRIYSKWDSKQPSSYVMKDLAMGKTPVLSIVARARGGRPVSWRSIANGAQDRQIAAHADGLKSVGKPIILGFHHEPENDTGRNGSAADYAAAFRHYVEVFRARGADNVSFAWILVAWSFNDRSRYNVDAYYPGDSYIDWISADGYNPYGCHGPRWKSMEEVLTPFRDWARPHRKPLLIAEFGTRDKRGEPGAKADWLRDATRTFESWPEIKAVSYYHSSLGCGGWHLDGKDDIDAYADMGRALKNGDNGGGGPGSILPVIDSPAVSSAEPGTATVSANVSAGSKPVSVSVEYGVTRRYGSSVVMSPELPAGEELVALEADISGLSENRTYHFRVVAEGPAGRSVSPDLTLAKEAAPVIRAVRAGNRTPTGATIKARIKAGSTGATWHVEYGQSTAYGDSTAAADLPAERSRVATELTGLQPGTRYHFRVVVSSGGETVTSDDRTFTTRKPPKVTNKRLRNVGRSTATYVGTAWLRGQGGTWWVEYGTTFQLASRTKASKLAGSFSGRQLRRTLTGLQPGTRYYVRAVVSTEAGTFAGRTRAFTTKR